MRICAMLTVLGLTTGAAMADGIFADNYNASMTIDASAAQLAQTSMNIAWDGTSYWTSSGGNDNGARMARFNASGAWVESYAPGVDLRSLATADGGAAIFARGFSSRTMYMQIAPGVLAPYVNLHGGTLDAQSSVVISDDGLEFMAMHGGDVERWSATDGSFIGTVTLNGYGNLTGETNYPHNRGLAVLDGNLLTYSDGTLSAWDMSGERIGTTILNGAGTDFDSHFSMGVANGRVWVIDDANGTWRGYAVPAPGAVALLGLGGFAAARRRR